MTTFTYPGPPRPTRAARVRRRLVHWFDRDFHRYATNVVLLVLVLYALAASFQWHDLTGH